MGRSALILVGLAALLATLTGCGLARHQFRDQATYQVAVTEINIDTGGGSVKVRPGSASSVLVRRHVFYAAKRPGQTSSVDGTTLKLTGCIGTCSVDYDITAPAGVKITGGSGSGDIDVTNVSTMSVRVGSGDVRVHHATGSVSAETGSGDIQVVDVQGAASARTGSGDVTLTDVSGDVLADTGSGDLRGSGLHGRTIAHTDSGDLTLRIVDAQDVTAQTGSGDLVVTVPSGQHYRIDASTGSGDKRISVSDDTGADHHLDLRTDSGDLTLRPA
jgi:DUF4097 and DUF4098 domain-containing protein YvlB